MPDVESQFLINAVTVEVEMRSKTKYSANRRRARALGGYRQLQFEVGPAFAIDLNAQTQRVEPGCR
jgi:hypothetical protein